VTRDRAHEAWAERIAKSWEDQQLGLERLGMRNPSVMSVKPPPKPVAAAQVDGLLPGS
jgi:hypothetical protein